MPAATSSLSLMGRVRQIEIDGVGLHDPLSRAWLGPVDLVARMERSVIRDDRGEAGPGFRYRSIGLRSLTPFYGLCSLRVGLRRLARCRSCSQNFLPMALPIGVSFSIWVRVQTPSL